MKKPNREEAEPKRANTIFLSFPRIVLSGGTVHVHQPFTTPRNYEAYVKRTNEKTLLHKELSRAYWAGELPIRRGDVNKKILDLGCGLGTNTQTLLNLFENHDVCAIDISKDFLNHAKSYLIDPNRNLLIEHTAFEDFSPRYHFDFILCSHVLQYIDTPLVPFLKKIIESLTPNGEAWIVLQEERGINQLIHTSRPFLDNPSPYFSKWFVHDQVRNILLELGVEIRSRIILSYFRAPDLNNLGEEDVALLNFILLNGFDPRNDDLLHALDSTLRTVRQPSGLIPHEIGITKLRRTS